MRVSDDGKYYEMTAFVGGDGRSRIPDLIRDYLAKQPKTCAFCRQPIHASVTPVVEGVETFHPSHAPSARAMRRASMPTPAPAPSAMPIAELAGSVGRLFDPAGCEVMTDRGFSQHERYAVGCFADSIARGGQYLDVSHSGIPLRGRCLSIRPDALALKWRFELLDGVRERDALAKIRTGAIRGCSLHMEFARQDVRDLGARGWEYTRAHLKSIALVDRTTGAVPSWFGTFVSIEA